MAINSNLILNLVGWVGGVLLASHTVVCVLCLSHLLVRERGGQEGGWWSGGLVGCYWRHTLLCRIAGAGMAL